MILPDGFSEIVGFAGWCGRIDGNLFEWVSAERDADGNGQMQSIYLPAGIATLEAAAAFVARNV